MKLAPKFKQWVDSLTEIKGIIGFHTSYDIQIDEDKTIEVDIYVKGKTDQGNDLISRIDAYSGLHFKEGKYIKTLSLDEDHEEYLNKKLTELMKQKDLQTWVSLYKEKKRNDYLSRIDSFFLKGEL